MNFKVIRYESTKESLVSCPRSGIEFYPKAGVKLTNIVVGPTM